MSEIQASVIVPVYKAEKYLRRCLDSIAAQTYKDFEVILIDDGSPDRSGEICDEYAAKDTRFRVFHQKNRGVTKTREIGINKAQGKYVFWVDADDYIDAFLLEKVMKQFKETDSDIVIYGSYELQGDNVIRTKSWTNQPIEYWRRAAINGKENNLWNFAVLRKYWQGEQAPKEMARAAADGYMVIRLFMKATHVEALPDHLYYYWRDNADSITHDFSGKRYQGNAYSWYYRLRVCEENFPQDIKTCAEKTLSGAVKAFCMSMIYNDLTEEEQKKLIQLLRTLENYPIRGRIRDSILRWAILHHQWWMCRMYAERKDKKSHKKNAQIIIRSSEKEGKDLR